MSVGTADARVECQVRQGGGGAEEWSSNFVNTACFIVPVVDTRLGKSTTGTGLQKNEAIDPVSLESSTLQFFMYSQSF
jgi:hypothetical protein